MANPPTHPKETGTVTQLPHKESSSVTQLPQTVVQASGTASIASSSPKPKATDPELQPAVELALLGALSSESEVFLPYRVRPSAPESVSRETTPSSSLDS